MNRFDQRERSTCSDHGRRIMLLQVDRLDHLVQNGLLGLVTGASGLGTYWAECQI